MKKYMVLSLTVIFLVAMTFGSSVFATNEGPSEQGIIHQKATEHVSEHANTNLPFEVEHIWTDDLLLIDKGGQVISIGSVIAPDNHGNGGVWVYNITECTIFFSGRLDGFIGSWEWDIPADIKNFFRYKRI